MKIFSGKTAVITGAGSGMGRALALQLYAAGANLALCDVNRAGLDETLSLLGGESARVSLHIVDVASLEQMNQFAGAVVAHHGQVDILFNNAGITLTPTLFESISEEQFQRVININMWGVYNGTRAFLPYLKNSSEAAIVNISSVAGLVGLYGYGPYAMSKFAVRGLSEVLQMELVGTSIHVLVVHPGGVKTNIIKNAPDLDDSRREGAHSTFTKTALLSADYAARQILRALRKKKYRLVLGTDAKIVNFIRTVFPHNFPKILSAVFSQAMFK